MNKKDLITEYYENKYKQKKREKEIKKSLDY